MQKSSSSATVFRAPETIRLGDILTSFELDLELISGSLNDVEATVLDYPVQWVHGSDLLDPSAFLASRTVLLTTGTQFLHFSEKWDYVDYVHKLLRVGVTALGFGVEIVFSEIPPELIEICDELQLPLFKVPYETPFIQISQTAAQLLAAKSYERQTWSLETQRLISRAAVRGRSIYAALDTLSAKLNRWAAIVTSSGRVSYTTTSTPSHVTKANWLSAEATKLLKRGTHANSSRAVGGNRVHLQTIPGSQGSVGVLIVESETHLDHAERGVIEFVIALASFYLEQQRSVVTGHSQIQNSVFQLLLDGQDSLAMKVTAAAGLGEIPQSVRVAYFGNKKTLTSAHLEQLRSFVAENPGSLLSKISTGLALLIPAPALSKFANLCETENIKTGVSKAHKINSLQTAVSEAQAAYQFSKNTTEYDSVTIFSPAKSGSLIDLLKNNAAAVKRAHLFLEPLREHDEKHADKLLETLKIWLINHGQNSGTAKMLNVHRHTVSNRIKTIFELLQRDADDPFVRAECQNALTLTSASSIKL